MRTKYKFKEFWLLLLLVFVHQIELNQKQELENLVVTGKRHGQEPEVLQ